MKKNFWDIKITRSLLDKDESELSELEKEAIAEFNDRQNKNTSYTEQLSNEIQENCKMLCSGEEHDLIPAAGWRHPIAEMAYALEKLNYFYKPYHLKVVFDQTKEKFGTFRGYWSIVHVPHGIRGCLQKFFAKLGRNDNTTWAKYGMKLVVDKEASTTLEWTEIDENDFNLRLDAYGKHVEKSEVFKPEDMMNDTITYIGVGHPDITYFKQSADGKYYRSYWLIHSRKCHCAPTRLKLLFKLKKLAVKASNYLDKPEKTTGKQQVMYNAFYNEVTKLVKECEDDCYDHCERCGTFIGERGIAARCETTGWISYLCPDCASARGGKYYNTKTKKWYVEFNEVEMPNKQ